MTFKIKPGAIDRLLTSPAARRDIERRAAAVRDACNAQSSWGGYESGPENNRRRASANVWNIDGRGSREEARSQRMIRNLDAGR